MKKAQKGRLRSEAGGLCMFGQSRGDRIAGKEKTTRLRVVQKQNRSAFCLFGSRAGLRRVQPFREGRLLVCGVVFVQNAFGRGGIDGGRHGGQHLFGCFHVAGSQRFVVFADRGLDRGFDHFILRILLLGDSYALFCGFDVRHNASPFRDCIRFDIHAILTQKKTLVNCFLREVVISLVKIS